MLRLELNQQEYEIPLREGVVTGTCALDENWRDMDYENKDNHLGLQLRLVYEVPLDHTEVLYNAGLVSLGIDDLQESERNLIILEIDINHGYYDSKKRQVLMHDGFPRFPKPSFLEGYKFAEQTVAASTFWFPSFGVPAKLSAMYFGGLRPSSKIGFNCDGNVKDAVAEMNFSIQETDLSLQFDFEIKGYAEHFQGFSKEDRIKEIQDCFESLYDVQKYSAKIEITDTEYHGVRITYEHKS